jgi:hypothetical protein
MSLRTDPARRALPLIAFACLLLAHAALVRAGDKSPGACVAENAEFDRPDASRLAVVAGSPGAHVRLYPKNPAACAVSNTKDCGRAYLLPGDHILAGSTCDAFTHVRYAGASVISTGWVDSKFVSPLPAADGDKLSALEGYYSSSGHCTQALGGQPAEPCGVDSDSCLLLKKLDATHAQIDIESFQGNGHECGLSGIAELHGSRLVYVQKGRHNEDDGRGIAIDTSRKTWNIEYLDDAQPHLNNAFCAINADLQMLTFDSDNKLPVNGQKCGS